MIFHCGYKVSRRGLGLLVALSTLLGVESLVAQSMITGTRQDLKNSPAWAISGAWAPGDSIIIIDSLHSHVLRFSPRGEPLKPIVSPGKGAKAFPKPSIIHPLAQGGYLLEDEDGHLLKMDQSLRPLKSFDLLKYGSGRKGSIRSVYNWAPFGSDVLTFSDVEDKGAWFSAFLRVPLGNPANFEILRRIEIQDPTRNFYLFGNSYVTTLADKGYFLVMDETPFLVEAAKGAPPRRMAALQGLLSRRPDLPENKGIGSVRSLFQALEDSAMPVGLYGWNNFLYVLMRRPKDSTDGTEWSLTKIDPRADKVVSNGQIDTDASHLTVIPGPKNWAFLEKGSVEGLGKQEILGVLLVPTARIEGIQVQ